MSQDLDVRELLSITGKIIAGKTFVHLATTLPNDHIDVGLGSNVSCQKLVGQEDDGVASQRFHHFGGIAGGAADVAFGLNVRIGVDVGDDGDTGILFPQVADIFCSNAGRQGSRP